MLELAQGVREQIIKETKPKLAPPKSFTMRRLRHAALWGVGAAGALVIAVVSSRGDLVSARLTELFHSNARAPVATAGIDTQATTQRLALAVNRLIADNDQMKSRLTTVEQSMDDITGSIGKQIQAADEARHFENGPTLAATAIVTAANMPTMPTVPSMPTDATPATTVASAPDAAQAPPSNTAPSPVNSAPARLGYGIEIGSGPTIQALRARWMMLRAAHPQLLDALEPLVNVKDVPHGNHIELRLVAGPLPQASAAAQLCAALAPFGVLCQPTMYDGQRLALH
jgi:hypothetical protein